MAIEDSNQTRLEVLGFSKRDSFRVGVVRQTLTKPVPPQVGQTTQPLPSHVLQTPTPIMLGALPVPSQRGSGISPIRGGPASAAIVGRHEKSSTCQDMGELCHDYPC
jgi:hypothetical protein